MVAALVREFPALRLDLRLFELAGEGPVDADVEIFVEGASTATGGQVSELVHEPYVAVLPRPPAGRPVHDRAGRAARRAVGRQRLLPRTVPAGRARRLRGRRLRPAFHIETHDYPSAIAFVAAGMGITVLPRLGTATLPPGVRAVALVDPTPRRRVMLRAKDALRGHPAVARAVQLLTLAAGATR